MNTDSLSPPPSQPPSGASSTRITAVLADDERLMRDQLRARLAEVWPALGSPVGVPPDETAARAVQWRQALQAASRQRRGFEVWVTHQFVMSAMAGRAAASGEGWVINPGPDGAAQILATLPAWQT